MSTLPTARPTQGVAPDLSSRCSGCAGPLAPDQLFCLSCGTRRRDARIAFRDVLASEAAPIVAVGSGSGGGALPPGTVVAAPGVGGAPNANYTPFIAVLALLLLAVGVGVWIGRGQQAPVATAAPMTVPIAATTPAAPVETTPAEDAAAKDDAAAEEESDDAATSDAETPGGGAAAIKKLEALSPEEYQKQSQKLPKEVGTGGKPPAKDGKTGGGGTEFESFE